MPCRYFSFPRIKSISASSKCCPPPGRWQKRTPTFLHRLAPLSALHPLLCPSGQLKRKKNRCHCEGASQLSLLRRLACSACQARRRSAVAIPRWLSSISKACSVSSSPPPGLHLPNGGTIAVPAASAEPEEVWSAWGKRRRDVAPHTPRCYPSRRRHEALYGSLMRINPFALIAFVRCKPIRFAACSGKRRGEAQPLVAAPGDGFSLGDCRRGWTHQGRGRSTNPY